MDFNFIELDFAYCRGGACAGPVGSDGRFGCNNASSARMLEPGLSMRAGFLDKLRAV